MNINHSIKELELSETNEKCLTEAGIIVVKDLLRLNQEQLLAIKGMGKKNSREVIRKLANHSLRLGDSDANIFLYQKIAKMIEQHERTGHFPALSANQYFSIIRFLWKKLHGQELPRRKMDKKLEEITSNNMIDDLLKQQSVSQLGLSIPTRRRLERTHIKSIYDLLRTSEKYLLAHRNVGQKSLNEIKQKMAEKGLSLGEKTFQDLSIYEETSENV